MRRERPGDNYFAIKRARLRLLRRCKIVGDCWIWQGTVRETGRITITSYDPRTGDEVETVEIDRAA